MGGGWWYHGRFTIRAPPASRLWILYISFIYTTPLPCLMVLLVVSIVRGRAAAGVLEGGVRWLWQGLLWPLPFFLFLRALLASRLEVFWFSFLSVFQVSSAGDSGFRPPAILGFGCWFRVPFGPVLGFASF